MPRSRRRRKDRKEEIPQHILAHLLCEEESTAEFRKDDYVAWDYLQLDFPTVSSGAQEIWERTKAIVLPEWIRRHPGTRPPFWWHFDAPREPKGLFPGCYYDGRFAIRKRLGGIGRPIWEKLNYVPQFECGLPEQWDEPSIDPDDPPVFESQATYLQRHGLLEREEMRKLKAVDFKPEYLGDANGTCLRKPRRPSRDAKIS